MSLTRQCTNKISMKIGINEKVNSECEKLLVTHKFENHISK